MTVVDWQFLLFACVSIVMLFTLWIVVRDLIDLMCHYRQYTFTNDFDEDGV